MWSWANPYEYTKARHIGHSGEDVKQLPPRLNLVYQVAKLCIMVAVGITVFFFQLKNRPKVTDIYYTGDYRETARGGFQYTCGCSLPTSLQSPKDLDPSDLAKMTPFSLNVCYLSSSLETVTVLMYNAQSKAAAIIEPVIKDVSNSLNSSDGIISIPYRTLPVDGGGYLANQEAHDLSGPINRYNSTPLPDLTSLYVGGYQQEIILASIEYLLGANFLDFPISYVRLSFVYRCSDCTICSITKVNSLITQVVSDVSNDEIWGNCFEWGYSNDYFCNPERDRGYQAKCLLYPGTKELPPSFAVKRFFQTLQNLPGITIGQVNGYEMIGININMVNSTVLQPSSLYLNISHVVRSSIRFGFVEVAKGSAETSVWWSTLSNQFPTLGTACANIQAVDVCSGTSVCNMFTNVKSGYDTRCLDMSNQTKCHQIMLGTTVDNIVHGDVDRHDESWTEFACPQFNCKSVPPYKVIWNTSRSMDKDSLNQFLASRILDSYWVQQSGVCTNTYSNVFRYRYAEGEAPFPAPSYSTLLLATDCVSRKLDQTNISRTSLYCWLTGEYFNLTDMPEDRSVKRNLSNLNPELFDPTDLQFVCYRVYTQDFFPWFVIVVGVVFGWVGTAQLLLTGFVKPLSWCLSSSKDKMSNTPATPRLLQRGSWPRGVFETGNSPKLSSPLYRIGLRTEDSV